MGALQGIGGLVAGVAGIVSLFRSGSGPAAAPRAPSVEEVAQLNEARAELEQARRANEEARQQNMASEEELSRREEALRRREQEIAEEAEGQRQREEEARNYPLQLYQVQSGWKDNVNVGLVGNSGVGKSLLSNNLRGVQRGQQGWAGVGVNETTMQPTMYPFPNEPRARLWDLPGAGTAAFPREQYIRNMGLRHYDAVLVVSAGRFTETETMLLQELREYHVPFFAVRTKIDVDIENNQRDNGVLPVETMRLVVDDLRRNGVSDPYLVALRDHDFEKLARDLHAAVVANRRYADL